MINTRCPYCDYKATKHESIHGPGTPKDKDISFCIECGEISTYLANTLIKLNINDLDELTKQKLKDLEIAWLQTQQQNKFIREKEKK